MNPVKRAVALSLLNVVALFILRSNELSQQLSFGKNLAIVEITGSHFLLFWIVGMLMILFTALVAGKLSLPSSVSWHQWFSSRR